MADVYFWLGDADETTATVVVRSDTAGELTLTGGANDGPIAVDPATEYGIVKFTVTGLAAGTSYPFAILLDGVEVDAGTLRTLPASGPWRFGFGSCVGGTQSNYYGYQLVNAHDVRAWFALGDTPYCDEEIPANTLGQTRFTNTATIPSVYKSWSAGRASWDATYARLQKTPGWEYLTQHVPLYRMPDDHEYGNDWDWSLDNVANFGAPAPAITTQAQIDTCGGYANAAMWSWNKGNPANTDPEIGDWAPEPCADAASNHPPKYFRKRVCNVEFFFIDCYAHMDGVMKSDPQRTVCIDNAEWNAALGYTYSDPAVAAQAKTRLGPYQLNWLLTHLASSTARFKVVLSGKTTHRAQCRHDNEGWSNYAAERDYILAFIRRYVSGVLWLSGDIHSPSVISMPSGHACVNSSPLGEVQWLDGSGAPGYPKGYTEGTIWRESGIKSITGQGLAHNCYGVVDVAENYLRPQIYSEDGTLLWSGYLKAGKNYLQPSLDEPGEWA